MCTFDNAVHRNARIYRQHTSGPRFHHYHHHHHPRRHQPANTDVSQCMFCVCLCVCVCACVTVFDIFYIFLSSNGTDIGEPAYKGNNVLSLRSVVVDEQWRWKGRGVYVPRVALCRGQHFRFKKNVAVRIGCNTFVRWHLNFGMYLSKLCLRIERRTILNMYNKQTTFCSLQYSLDVSYGMITNCIHKLEA